MTAPSDKWAEAFEVVGVAFAFAAMIWAAAWGEKK